MSTADYPAGKSLSNQIIKLYYGERLSLSGVVSRLGIKGRSVEHQNKQAGQKLRPMGEAVRLAKVGMPRHNFTHSTHPGERSVDKWRIVELKVEGKGNREIAK